MTKPSNSLLSETSATLALDPMPPPEPRSTAELEKLLENMDEVNTTKVPVRVLPVDEA